MVLEGLDAIDWEKLSHAYGSASDVPDVLRAVAAGDADALYELYGNIWHQGTVYEATAHAVPFLYELALHPHVDAVSVVSLLRMIARGSSYADVHAPYEGRSVRESPEYQQRIERELAHVAAARRAVVDGVPVLLRLLAEGEVTVRETSAWALGALSESAAESVGVLKLAVERDSSPVVRAAAMLALAELGSPIASTHDTPLDALISALALDRDVIDAATEHAPKVHADLGRLGAVTEAGDPMTFVLDHVSDGRDQARLLAAWLRADDPAVRTAAAFACEEVVGRWRGSASWVTRALVDALEDSAEKVRHWAARNLAMCVFEAPQARDPLWSLVEAAEPTPNTPSSFALGALVQIGDGRAVDWVRQALRDDRAALAYRYVPQLEVDDALFETLLAIVHDVPAGNARIGVLGMLDRAEAVGALLAELDAHPHVCTRVLGDIGPAATAASERLRSMLGHSIQVVAQNAARALWTIDGDRSGLDALHAACVRSSYALKLVLELDAPLDGLEAVVDQHLTSDDSWLHLRAAALHWRMHGDAARVLPVLEPHVDGSLYGRATLRLLAEIGAEARQLADPIRVMVESLERVGVAGHLENAIQADQRWLELARAALTAITV